MAMVVSYYTGENITPDIMANYALRNGYRTSYQGTSWGYFSSVANQYGLEYLQTSSSQEALNWMNTKDNPLVICSMGPGLWTSCGHFIVVWKVEAGTVYINDPASTKENRLINSYNYMASQCVQYFCFNQHIEPIEIETITKEEDDIQIKKIDFPISIEIDYSFKDLEFGDP